MGVSGGSEEAIYNENELAVNFVCWLWSDGVDDRGELADESQSDGDLYAYDEFGWTMKTNFEFLWKILNSFQILTEAKERSL